MKAIHVLRKPLAGATVASNVLTHGTGVINVDGCRVGGTPGDGRWPANVVFQHLDGCKQDGTRQVKGSAPASGPTFNGRSTSTSRGVFNGVDRERSCYTDPLTGTETIVAYECAPGCPVAALDEQSGDLSSQATRNDPTRKLKQSSGITVDFESGNGVRKEYLSQTGGASRFFKQFVGKRPVGEDW